MIGKRFYVGFGFTTLNLKSLYILSSLNVPDLYKVFNGFIVFFLQGRATKKDNMDQKFFDNLKVFNARRKFKGGMIAVTALTSTFYKAKEKK